MGGVAQYFHSALWRDWFEAAIAQLGYAAFWLAVLRIIFVNFLLSGDNAVVIAMACRGLPPPQRRWGLVIGAAVAVVLRILLVGSLAWLMRLAYFKLLGGIALLFIAAKLLVPEATERDDIHAAAQLWRAVTIIAFADIVMSIDNMVAIAAIAQGNFLLLVFGLVVSVPLIVVGAAVVMALLERFPLLIWLGTALLGWIAGELIVADPALTARVTAAFGVPLLRQIAFAAPATGAALAIAAGGLWRSWHESGRSREHARNA
ncbi:MAG TPA: TerC family protein [Xanthobacteraceae bacterium]|nr:TerC family protein [Xanthobacteraceae bacterium]